MSTAEYLRRSKALGGKYRLLAELGQGGTSTVALAVARGPSGFNKLVVLKMLKPDLAQERELCEMFMTEARIAARLNHPNVVQTLEVFEDQGLPVLVMEYLEGQSLEHVIESGRGSRVFTRTMHLRVIADVLGGLHYSHELRDFDGTPLNLVHRDISPPNVFVTFDGRVQLLDFGVAKFASSRIETEAGVLKGKIPYMAPEQIAGGELDRRADIYAIGVMLWEAATGRRMWADVGESEIINRVMNGEVPSPRRVSSDVDSELDRIVVKATQPDPNARYATAAELQAELERLLGTQVRPRDIGRAVCELFKDVRTETRRVIEQQLSRIAELSDEQYASGPPAALCTIPSPNAINSSQPTVHVQVQQASAGPARTRLLFAVLGAAVAIALVAAWSITRRSPAGPDRAAARGSAAPPAVSSVWLRVTAFPAFARIYLDGKALPSNPYARQVAPEGTPHLLRVEAEGHATEERDIMLQMDNEIVIALRRIEAAAPAPAVSTSAAPATPAVKPGKRAPPVRANCQPPFTIDSAGVKRYKPECL